MDKENGTLAVILAGGSGTRMRTDIPKQYLRLAGETVMHRAVRMFQLCPAIDKIVMVTRPGETDLARAECRDMPKVIRVIAGGSCRAESAHAGFLCAREVGCSYVAFHDAARPLITPDAIARAVEKARECGAACVARRVSDTVKRLDMNGNIISTEPRDNMIFSETPQIFRAELYEKAISAIPPDGLSGVTDDNMLLERIGIPVVPVYTEGPNIKITTPADLRYAEFLIQEELL